MNDYRELLLEEQSDRSIDQMANGDIIYTIDLQAQKLARVYSLIDNLFPKMRNGLISMKLLRHQGKRLWKISDKLLIGCGRRI